MWNYQQKSKKGGWGFNSVLTRISPCFIRTHPKRGSIELDPNQQKTLLLRQGQG